MIELREKCLRALADFLQSSRLADGGLCPMLLKKSEETRLSPVISTRLVTEPFGISHETWFRVGLLEIYSSTIRQVSNQPGPVEGLRSYMLGDLFELEPANFFAGETILCEDGTSVNRTRWIVSRGQRQSSGSVGESEWRQKERSFVDTLLDLIASGWNGGK
jgi:hypothetical protein